MAGNTLKAVDVSEVPVPASLASMHESAEAYLFDESKMRTRAAQMISRPKSREEVAAVLRDCNAKGISVTVSGSRTGLVGSGVPEREGQILSLELLKGIRLLPGSEPTLYAEAGVTLAEIDDFLRTQSPDFFFPVDPTERSASVGGMIATNAGGSRSYHYGSIRDWIAELELVLPSGRALNLQRGRDRVADSKLEIDDGTERSMTGTTITKPKTKHSIGYSFDRECDVIDLIVGAEGTLGAVTSAVLKLTKRPQVQLFFLQFFREIGQAFTFVEKVRSSKELNTLAIEFLDERSLRLAGESTKVKENRLIRKAQEGYRAAVFCEFELQSDHDFEHYNEQLSILVHTVGADYGDSVAAIEAREILEIRELRHAVPERINSIIAKRKQDHPALHKIASDMSVPNEKLRWVYQLYCTKLDALGVDYAVFGHIGNNHFHVNMLPKDEQELVKVKALYKEFAKEIVNAGGAVAAEHGIGRLKREFLTIQYSPAEIECMRKIRALFDPNGIMNPGALFK